MSMDAITRDIAQDVKVFLKNPKIKPKDIVEWSTAETKAADDTEVSFQLPNVGGIRYALIWVTISKALDKRGA